MTIRNIKLQNTPLLSLLVQLRISSFSFFLVNSLFRGIQFPGKDEAAAEEEEGTRQRTADSWFLDRNLRFRLSRVSLRRPRPSLCNFTSLSLSLRFRFLGFLIDSFFYQNPSWCLFHMCMRIARGFFSFLGWIRAWAFPYELWRKMKIFGDDFCFLCVGYQSARLGFDDRGGVKKIWTGSVHNAMPGFDPLMLLFNLEG